MQGEVKEDEGEECRWAVKARGRVDGGEVAAPNREDKWMALTFPSGQRAGQPPWPLTFAPSILSTDTSFHPLFLFLILPVSVSFFPSCFLIWFDWRRNVVLLKVAAEEQ